MIRAFAFVLILALAAACAHGVERTEADTSVPVMERANAPEWRCIVDFGVRWNDRYFPNDPLSPIYADGQVRIIAATQPELVAIYERANGTPRKPRGALWRINALTTTWLGIPVIVFWDELTPARPEDVETMGAHEPHHVRQQKARMHWPSHPGFVDSAVREAAARQTELDWRAEFGANLPPGC